MKLISLLTLACLTLAACQPNIHLVDTAPIPDRDSKLGVDYH